MTAINSNRAIRGPVTAVPFVAGTGVRLVADTANNRIVVEADETVLWSGDTGAIIDSTNGSVTLSETAMNFEKIRLYAQGSALNSGGSTIDVTIGSTDPLSFMPVSLTYTNDGSSMFTDCCVVQFNGTSFAYKSGFRIAVSSAPALSRQNNRGLKIVKVVGINRIASN